MRNIVLLALLFCMMAFVPANKSSQGILKTSLQITILDELGNPVEGASVELYKTEEDYLAFQNPATEKMLTDKKGKVTFRDLEPIAYYVNAERDGATNDGAGAKTEKLIEKRLNKVNIIIE
jgi:uncharacterized GH25 family protein